MKLHLKIDALINAVCGALAGLVLIYAFLWPFVFVSIIPLLHLATAGKYSRREVFFSGLAWGFGLMSVSLSFIFGMLPLGWLGISSVFIGTTAAVGLWTALSLCMALPVGLFALLLLQIQKRHNLVFLCITPVLWVLLELVRAVIISVLALGPGTSIGPYFTFGFLGYALSGAQGLLFLAQFGGPLFLSWFVVLINTLVFLLLQKIREQKKLIQITLCAASVIFLASINAVVPPYVHVSIGAPAAVVGGEQVALVHSQEQAYFKETTESALQVRSRLSEAVLDALQAAPSASVVVLPEDSRFERIILNPHTDADHTVLEALRRRQVLLIDSSRIDAGADTRSIIYAYDFKENAPFQFSAKSYLVPFGEYIPYVVSFAAPIFGFKAQIQNLVESRASYISAPWNPQERIVTWNGISYGILSCSELFSPYLVRDLTRAGADVVVAMSSQSWMQRDSPVLYNQMLGMAIVDTAWTGKPYMQATNKAPNIHITAGY